MLRLACGDVCYVIHSSPARATLGDIFRTIIFPTRSVSVPSVGNGMLTKFSCDSISGEFMNTSVE